MTNPNSENTKDLMVEVRWIRPTKLCAILDLILAIICYIIAILSSVWVKETDTDSYYANLNEHCYEIGRAAGLINEACDSSRLSADIHGTNSQFNCLTKERQDLQVKAAALGAGETEFACLRIDEVLPWHMQPLENIDHHWQTYWLLIACLIGCIICFFGALIIYWRTPKDVDGKTTAVFKIIGIVLIILSIVAFIAEILFGVGQRSAVPYHGKYKFAWGFGFAFAAGILTLIAGTLFFCGTQWKKDVYRHRRTFALW